MLILATLVLATAKLQGGAVGVDLIGNAPMTLGLGGIATGSARVGSAEISVNQVGVNNWSAQVFSPVFNRALNTNEVIYVTYEARCVGSQNSTNSGFWSNVIQRSVAPYDNIGFASTTVDNSWKQLHFVAKVDKPYPINQTGLALHVGSAIQSLEFRNLAIKLYPVGTNINSFPTNSITYPGRDLNSPWRATAAAMIEQNRKADLKVVVMKGKRVLKNASVAVTMLKHAYPFGTFAEYDVPSTTPDANKYRSFLNSPWFSRITVPIYWTDWGWESAYSRNIYLQTIDWAKKNSVRMKGHNLLWPSDQWLPADVRPLRGEPLRTRLITSLEDRLTALQNSGFENIDVVNELKTEHDIPDRLGEGIIGDFFKKTRLKFPVADLVYNDYDLFEGSGGGGNGFNIAVGWTNRLKNMGAPLTLSGWQGHFGEDLTSPPAIWTMIDRWKASTGLPVEITEFDVDTSDEQAQADYTRDILTAVFAHPDTKGFTIWGFWEATHWRPRGAMFRTDWSRKPNSFVWEQLVTKDWWTRAQRLSGKDGSVNVRGFMGDYKVVVEDKVFFFSLPKEGKTITINLKG
jgi:endo-1,4-beta-xylanase